MFQSRVVSYLFFTVIKGSGLNLRLEFTAADNIVTAVPGKRKTQTDSKAVHSTRNTCSCTQSARAQTLNIRHCALTHQEHEKVCCDALTVTVTTQSSWSKRINLSESESESESWVCPSRPGPMEAAMRRYYDLTKCGPALI
jgi:hypothetical protein